MEASNSDKRHVLHCVLSLYEWLQVAMDMKAQGMYVCRTLSFAGGHDSLLPLRACF